LGRDHHPRMRQAKQLQRKASRRDPYDRILIVCEGLKTEPNYFKEIRQVYRLNTANIEVRHSQLGTCPLQVVQYAHDLFTNGDSHHRIPARAFERVYAVFDRDEHLNYLKALTTAQRLNHKMRNDQKQLVIFEAIASVPCFELWLLLHYKDILHPIHRDDAEAQLKQYISNYQKGQSGIFDATKNLLQTALPRADRLLATNSANSDGPYTSVGTLVNFLTNLKQL
jgi:hypothetical protein